MMEFWSEAHQPADRMSEAEQDEIWEWMQSKPKVPLTLPRKGNGALNG